MNDYLSTVNSIPFYAIVALVLAFVVVMCVIFLVKSYKAGIALGMDPKDLKKVMTSSATFTLLPSISILLGVIALSGTLGVPFSWLRLSVIGSLQYELNVAEIAATAFGLTPRNKKPKAPSCNAFFAKVLTTRLVLISTKSGSKACLWFPAIMAPPSDGICSRPIISGRYTR